MFRSPISTLLVRGADPNRRARTARSQFEISPGQAEGLFDQAEIHGVLGSVLDYLSPHAAEPYIAAAYAAGKHRHRHNVIFSRLLQYEAETLIARTQGLPVSVIKGLVFAKKIYPKDGLRCYTDIDILAAESAIPKLTEILSDSGYRLAEAHSDRIRREWTWISESNGSLIVDIQTDLIHSDNLANSLSLNYDAIQSSPEGAAELLLIALVHGTAHLYTRLQQVVDVCQAARNLAGTSDEIRFEELVRATKSRLAVVTGLRLAGRILRERKCLELARALGGPAYAPLLDVLLTETVVLSATTERRVLHSWRRQAFRRLLTAGLN